MSIRFQMWLRFIIFGVFCIILLVACGGPDIPLTGTITNTYTGEPVASAIVRLGNSEATTTADGTFELTDWNTRSTLEVSAEGFEPLDIVLAERPEVAEPTPPAVTLDAQIRPNGLSGVVLDAYSETPLAGAQIQVSDAISTTTDAEGRYTLTELAPEFTLQITAPDYEPLEQQISEQTSFDAVLRPNVVSGVVTDSYTGAPIEGATIVSEDVSVTTNAEGRYRLEGVSVEATLEVAADGYATLTQPLEQSTSINASLRPDIISSVIVDSETGEPVEDATVIATPTMNSTAVASVRIDDSPDGNFMLEGIPEQGFLQVLAPGYLKTVIELEPEGIPEQIEMEPFEVRALYITAAVGAAGPSLYNEYLDLIDRTELNAIVIDLKSDLRDNLGLIYYDSQVPLVQELGTSADLMDIRVMLEEAKRRDIYTIARIQLFSHDNALADARPEWAIQDRETGEVFADLPGPNIRYAWLDPWNRNVWDYNIQLGVEAALLGFDEINYDYIRYPDWYGDLSEYAEALEFSEPTDPVNDPDAMFNNIVNFMEMAHEQMNGAGAYFSIDVFGRVVVAPSMPIGQDIERMAPHADYIAPMPYPSLWWPGFLGLDNPTAHPYEVMLGSIESGDAFFQGEGKRALQRPWLQDHTDPWQGARVVEYGPEEVRAQIRAAEDSGMVAGWMLYDSANTYTEGALRPVDQ
ncbi:MAG: hypothetical protein GFH27_549307n61 [Chloroflexi bacterium AL-W]|nr:hypothetical protein [Chloroflexi bacterium AL-N1]NOK69093.1 hypothetical protein [Chloroflexi bacterium AL-N10]NOK77076.1 hypothetical protein [Chloroflexi bacterium AL-N5]NOK83721.1 hypothetical protein [Chloroflexi bacterium AL-W]NOK90931.1 hypothetical protein [Chloroflexi bacterium AL-N15]